MMSLVFRFMAARSRARWRRAGGGFLAVVFAPSLLFAQFIPDIDRPRPDSAGPPRHESRERLRQQFGFEATRARIGADNQRAIERFGALKSEAALRELVQLAEDPTGLDDRALLLLARALWAYGEEPEAVRALYSIVARTSSEPRTSSSTRLRQLARQQAALALAAAEHPDGLSLLSRMVKRGHDDGALASLALQAHPPRDLVQVLTSPGAPNVMFVELLEALGDQRAFSALRTMVRRGNPEVRARAALALGRLGHLETVPLAQHWLLHSKRVEERAAATEILLQARDPGAKAAWLELFAEQRSLALELAMSFPRVELAQAISELPGFSSEPQLLTILGRIGGEASLAALENALTGASFDTAAYALARCPDPDATDILSRALRTETANHDTYRVVAMAAVVRAWLHGQTVPGLDKALERLRARSTLDDRFVGIWGKAVLNSDYAEAQLRSPSLLALRAAALAAAIQPKGFFRAAAQRLEQEPDPKRREVLLTALLHKSGRDEVSSHRLFDWAHDHAVLAVPAIRALSERDDERYAPALVRWLGSTDTLIRAAAALGAARHREPSITSRLAAAYRFEVEADVRWAIVAALSHREKGLVRDETLRLARSLDPDHRVRAAAGHALLGNEISLDPTGEEVAWLVLPDTPVPDALLLVSTGGLAVPLPTAGQRWLAVVGANSGDLRLRLAWTDEGKNHGSLAEREQSGVRSQTLKRRSK